MSVKLKRATVNDAELIWKMQVESFSALLEKYRDYDISPAAEALDKTVKRLNSKNTFYYVIETDEGIVGAIRIIVPDDCGKPKRISPLFVLPQFRNRGIAYEAIKLAEELHGESNWELETMLQEKANCRLYEKVGYSRTDEQEIINDRMTLIYYRK